MNYADPSGHFSLLAFAISIGVSLAFEMIEDAIDGGLFDGSHGWKDYLGAGISGALGGLGKTIVAQVLWGVVGDFADAMLSGDLEDDGFWNTMGNITVSSILSVGFGEVVNNLVVGIKASALKNIANNNLANRKLKAMGVNIKIGSNAAKAKHGLFNAIKNHDKWIGNVLSKDLVGAVSGGLTSMWYSYSW